MFDKNRERALTAIRNAHSGLLSAQRNLLGRRISLAGLHRDEATALKELREVERLIGEAICAIETPA